MISLALAGILAGSTMLSFNAVCTAAESLSSSVWVALVTRLLKTLGATVKAPSIEGAAVDNFSPFTESCLSLVSYM